MSTITGVHHIAIRASDFARTIGFYTETLGLTLTAEWTSKRGRAAMIQIVPGSYMEVFERPPESLSGSPPILHFALRTDDVDGMTERARAAGVEPLTVDLDTTIGKVRLRLSYIDGPDGESIELMSSDRF